MASDEPPKPDSQLRSVESSDVLDSIFADKGPMPAAKFGIRSIAFLMDFILITAVASVIIWKLVLPQSHPGTFAELKEWSESFVHYIGMQSENGSEIKIPEMSNNLASGLAHARDLQIMIFWFYFALSEIVFKGRTLGKQACRLRSVSTVTLGTPPLLAGILRGSLKTIVLFYPIGLIATLIARLFNKRRQLGHDLLSRTAVIDEKSVNKPLSSS